MTEPYSLTLSLLAILVGVLLLLGMNRLRRMTVALRRALHRAPMPVHMALSMASAVCWVLLLGWWGVVPSFLTGAWLGWAKAVAP